MSNEETALWKGKFGDAYIGRNIVTDEDVANRTKAWKMILDVIHANNDGEPPRSILEIGAGQGQNLLAISKLYDSYTIKPTLSAIEPNEYAYNVLCDLDLKLFVHCQEFETVKVLRPLADVVFTSGVLIHVRPEHLSEFMDKINAASAKFIVCLEYFSPECRQLPYHGHENLLYANDFGSLYLDRYGLSCIGVHFFWRRMTGLDNLTCWVFKKVN